LWRTIAVLLYWVLQSSAGSKEEQVNAHKEGSGGPGHDVTITVNNKPVVVTGPRLTGLEIKEAAINQGVDIRPSFILSQKEPGSRPKIIGDNDRVTVNKNSVFVANDDDDDS
jgi:Multiubiquitin